MRRLAVDSNMDTIGYFSDLVREVHGMVRMYKLADSVRVRLPHIIFVCGTLIHIWMRHDEGMGDGGCVTVL